MDSSKQYSPELIREAKIEAAKRVLASRKFLSFLAYTSPWFKVSWHHEKIADALERIENGTLKRLILELPPRHSKSEMASIAFPPWVLGRDKDKSIMQASYSADLAYEFGRQARNLVDSSEYRKVFDTTLSEDSQSKSTWATNGRGRYNALGVGGSATGKGAHILIIDDPIKNRKEADSFVVRESIYKWYQSTALTRLTPDGAVILVATRWHDDDLIGRVLQSETREDWEVIRFPAIADFDEEFRSEGEALWSERYNLERLLEIKKEIGSYEWSALYQQDPLNAETQEFNKTMFRTVSVEAVEAMNTSCWITIDPAVKEKDTADYTGTIVNYVNEENDWHIMASRKRINSAKLVDHVFDLWRDHKPDGIGIEETTYYDAVYPFMKLEMVKRNIFPVIYPLKHHGTNKEVRIRGLLPRYEARKIFHIEGQTESLEEEQLRFPKGANDDQVDALAYQEQIVIAPVAPMTSLQQALSEMQIDERTGYLKQ